MLLGISLSAWGVSFALVGICINLVIAKPYVGAAYYTDLKSVKRKMPWAYIGNILLVIGTVAQLVSLLLTKPEVVK